MYGFMSIKDIINILHSMECCTMSNRSVHRTELDWQGIGTVWPIQMVYRWSEREGK